MVAGSATGAATSAAVNGTTGNASQGAAAGAAGGAQGAFSAELRVAGILTPYTDDSLKSALAIKDTSPSVFVRAREETSSTIQKCRYP